MSPPNLIPNFDPVNFFHKSMVSKYFSMEAKNHKGANIVGIFSRR